MQNDTQTIQSEGRQSEERRETQIGIRKSSQGEITVEPLTGRRASNFKDLAGHKIGKLKVVGNIWNWSSDNPVPIKKRMERSESNLLKTLPTTKPTP